MPAFTIRPLSPADHDTVRALIAARWGAEIVVARGVVYRPHELEGFIANADSALAGLLTFRIVSDACQIVTLDSLRQRTGIGTALIEAAAALARARACRRLWLITTNDNTRALRFYQQRGFVLAALHRDAVAVSRRFKPSIPLLGDDGIPIRDELELEMPLA